MTRSNNHTYGSRRSNHAESSTTAARRTRQETPDRDRTDDEDVADSGEEDYAEAPSRPTQRAQASTQGGTESHQSRNAAAKKREMGAAVSATTSWLSGTKTGADVPSAMARPTKDWLSRPLN